ncbi:Site-specific recombinase XerD [Bradyrhizobium sp. Ghvi]|uniref:tyrosine-type recombinase/integrase n=1 Tax=Bradyrhizobium sp. Ghvi TaxID=1855319 RepID=UPI0008E83A06|nr:site-specific integrase [Bradyrhizobium sp. Ghvi]SFO18116.1 Site-specific recombinase XerD [Bradyrhizobium sp. Ghvi]
MSRKITAEYLETVTAPKGQRLEMMDPSCKGLQIRISEGAKTFAFVHRPKGGKPVRTTLGHFPDMKLAAARKRADELRGAAANGRDVHGEHRATRAATALAQATFGELVDAFVEQWSKARKRSWEADERYLGRFKDGWPNKAGVKRLTAWGRRSASTLSRSEIADALNTIAADAPVSSNRAHASLHKFFRWCVSEGKLAANPMAGLAKRHDESNSERKRALSAPELKAVWAELLNGESEIGATTRAALRFMLLTAQRPGEVAGMLVTETNLATKSEETWTIPGARTKNKTTHIVPLTRSALQIIRGELTGRSEPVAVFRSRTFGDRPMSRHTLSHACADIATKLKLESFTAHDLRRTAANLLKANGVAPFVVEEVLNHLPPKLQRIYQGDQARPERRAALETLARVIEEAVR